MRTSLDSSEVSENESLPQNMKKAKQDSEEEGFLMCERLDGIKTEPDDSNEESGDLSADESKLEKTVIHISIDDEEDTQDSKNEGKEIHENTGEGAETPIENSDINNNDTKNAAMAQPNDMNRHHQTTQINREKAATAAGPPKEERTPRPRRNSTQVNYAKLHETGEGMPAKGEQPKKTQGNKDRPGQGGKIMPQSRITKDLAQALNMDKI